MENQKEQFDQSALALSRAIGMQENGGNVPTEQDYLKKGASGERGAYQFLKPTWNKYAGEVLGDSNADPTPENQNKVVYGKVKKWKDSGYVPEQIASMWNAGEGRPNAYKENMIGATSTAKYNVPEYTKGVSGYYEQQLKSLNVQEQQKEPTNFLKKIVDFAFPIISDVGDIAEGKSKKTGLQLLGDLGLSALWFAPGIGAGAGAAIKGAGLLGRVGSRVAGEALGGAALGYGADVASKLSEGKTDMGQVLTPGVGAATGGFLGGAIGKLGSKFSQEGVLNSITKSNNSIIGQTKKGATELAEAFTKDHNIGELAAQKGINLASHINPETVAYNTTGLAQNVGNDIKNLNGVVSEALKNVKGTTNVSELEQRLINKVPRNQPERINLIKNEMNTLRQQYGEVIQASDVNDWKYRLQDLSKFDLANPAQNRTTYRIMSHEFKTEVENLAKQSGLDGIQEMNDYIGSHHDLQDILSFLNGTKAKGGRLGDIMQKTAFQAIGGATGGLFGGGWFGSLLGVLAGGKASDVMSNLSRKISSSPIKTAILNKIQREDPEIVQKMLEYAKSTPQGLEAINEFLEKQGVKLFKSGLKGSPILKPKQSARGLISGLIKIGGARVATQ
jgi:hypothetical protein